MLRFPPTEVVPPDICATPMLEVPIPISKLLAIVISGLLPPHFLSNDPLQDLRNGCFLAPGSCYPANDEQYCGKDTQRKMQMTHNYPKQADIRQTVANRN